MAVWYASLYNKKANVSEKRRFSKPLYVSRQDDGKCPQKHP